MTLALLAMLATLATPPADPAPLAPQGGWTLDHIGGYCAVSRSYGARAPTLILRQRLDGRRVDIALSGAGRSPKEDARVPGHMTSLPSGRQFDGTLRPVANPNGPPIIEISTGDDPLADFDAMSALTVDIGQPTALRFAIDQQVTAQTLLRDCHVALVRSWGVDPAHFSPLGASKVGARFFGASTYPPEAVKKREEGRVNILIEIAPSGRVDACYVVESSHSDSLDQATCDIARTKVRFTPAKDDAGQPTATWTVMPMRWVLPDR